jgi:DNA helicase HerA-like ATPase
MLEEKVKVFDNLEGKFLARLREIASYTRTTADGRASITFKTARIEAAYLPEVIRKIEAGRLIAIPNVVGVSSHDNYSIYEVADIYPMHYSMLTLDNKQPGPIRKEFMHMTEKEWEIGSNSTWIEIIAASTGYTMDLSGEKIPSFVKKNAAALIGSEVSLLSDETIQKFICYFPKEILEIDNFKIGHLLGATDNQIPFTINIEKLIHYHVWVFAFTGSGKSNLTSLIIRKGISTIPNVKFVIFDISAEYAINLLDLLKSSPSRIILTPLSAGENNNNSSIKKMTDEFLIRHVIPESLVEQKDEIFNSVEMLIKDDKIRTISISSESEQTMQQFSTYGGLMRPLADLTNEKFGAASQKVLIPTVVSMIRQFMLTQNLNEDSLMGSEIIMLLNSIDEILARARLRADAQLLTIFANLRIGLEALSETEGPTTNSKLYDTGNLVNEILDSDPTSAELFVINLPDVEVARYFCSEVISRIFRRRKSNFTLTPRIVFIFDEAQEFIPAEKRREDGTENSSRAVEKLLRHGRKYNLNGWISTQRIAHLNTNALQQLHSYFVSTMPRPYDIQLISDTFAIDDAFMDRTLTFQNGDWLMTSFKATNTQSVPVFFHAINNEDSILTDEK